MSVFLRKPGGLQRRLRRQKGRLTPSGANSFQSLRNYWAVTSGVSY